MPKGVDQILQNIHVTTEFLPDDLSKDNEVTDVPTTEQFNGDDIIEENDVDENEIAKLKSDLPDWDEVFQSVVGEEVSEFNENDDQITTKASKKNKKGINIFSDSLF